MKQNYLSEIIYQVFALIICVIVVHTVYVAVVLPNAAFILEQQAAMQAADSSYVAPRSLYVILRDMEQETCIILMFWALAIVCDDYFISSLEEISEVRSSAVE